MTAPTTEDLSVADRRQLLAGLIHESLAQLEALGPVDYTHERVIVGRHLIGALEVVETWVAADKARDEVTQLDGFLDL